MNHRRPITTVTDLTDYIHHSTSEESTIIVEHFLKKIHNKIVASLRAGEQVHDGVLLVYFKMACLLTGREVTRHRLIATIDGISDWYNSH